MADQFEHSCGINSAPSVSYQAIELEKEIRDGFEIGFIDEGYDSNTTFAPSLLFNKNSRGETIRDTLLEATKSCDEYKFSVAFITRGGLAQFEDIFQDPSKKGKILTTDYLAFNDPQIFRWLLEQQNTGTVEVRIFEGNLHAKGYLFNYKNNFSQFIVGSTNLTDKALSENEEWNLMVSSLDDGKILKDAENEFTRLWNEESSKKLSQTWIAGYEKRYLKEKSYRQNKFSEPVNETGSDEQEELKPNGMQKLVLQTLGELHESKARKALLISATGTGKTYLAAMDVKNVNPRRMLFVVHREKIARTAKSSFERILPPGKSFGILTGSEKKFEADCIFSTVLSLRTAVKNNLFDPQDFDYIVVDETHHAAAKSYADVIDFFKPKFMLGMTATPERTDGEDIYEIYDHNIAGEIRLRDALEQNMLVPFHYFGITEIQIDGEVLSDELNINRLTCDERVQHVVENAKKYGYSGPRLKGLVFCRRNDEAALLASKFSIDYGYKTLALSGEDDDEARSRAIDRLEQDSVDGCLDYIFTVDIFNEGIDIPSVNQIIMLRPTISPIVFTQQLGRGLRLSDEKECLFVLDFIGNYDNNYLISVALAGDKTLNKQELKKVLVDGGSSVPGSSTISFDEISREHVLRSLEETNFSNVRIFKPRYLDLKKRLGRIPRLMDFVENEQAFLPQLIFSSSSKNYLSFLERYDEEYEEKLNELQKRFLDFISVELANGKRPDELLLLKEMLSLGTVANTGKVSALDVLSLEFFNNNSRRKYLPLIEQNNIHSCFLSLEFAKALETPFFYRAVDDLIDYSLEIYEMKYKKGTPFVVGEEYTRGDAARLLGWSEGDANTIYGYMFKEDSPDWVIFVTYHKGSDVDPTIDYPDRFLDPSHFLWMSRKGQGVTDKHALQLKNSSNKNIHLFVKRGQTGQEHCYVGTVKPESKLTRANTKGEEGKTHETFKVTFRLDAPVEKSTYDVLTKTPDLDFV